MRGTMSQTCNEPYDRRLAGVLASPTANSLSKVATVAQAAWPGIPCVSLICHIPAVFTSQCYDNILAELEAGLSDFSCVMDEVYS